jgi:hypothetical protein
MHRRSVPAQRVGRGSEPGLYARRDFRLRPSQKKSPTRWVAAWGFDGFGAQMKATICRPAPSKHSRICPSIRQSASCPNFPERCVLIRTVPTRRSQRVGLGSDPRVSPSNVGRTTLTAHLGATVHQGFSTSQGSGRLQKSAPHSHSSTGALDRPTLRLASGSSSTTPEFLPSYFVTLK